MLPGRVLDASARVLKIQAPTNVELTLEGSETCFVKMHTGLDPWAYQLFCQLSGCQNQRTDGPTYYHNQGEPQQQNSFQTERKLQFIKNSQQGMKLSGKKQNFPKNEDSQQQNMADFILKCVGNG